MDVKTQLQLCQQVEYTPGVSIRVEKWTSLTEETENNFPMSSENDQLFTKYLIETS